MPESRKRKKDGKTVGNGKQKRVERLERAGDMETGVTLQDLINTLAYQEYVKDGTIVAEDAKITIPDEIPVTVDQGDEKRVVGKATRIPGAEKTLSINITDPEALAQVKTQAEIYSIYSEEQE